MVAHAEAEALLNTHEVAMGALLAWLKKVRAGRISPMTSEVGEGGRFVYYRQESGVFALFVVSTAQSRVLVLRFYESEETYPQTADISLALERLEHARAIGDWS